ncbi:MAG: hypothetical protein INR71_01560 [Terriglobus roseus]|nr:hypothetical protein [Terriglobus roseus]
MAFSEAGVETMESMAAPWVKMLKAMSVPAPPVRTRLSNAPTTMLLDPG